MHGVYVNIPCESDGVRSSERSILPEECFSLYAVPVA